LYYIIINNKHKNIRMNRELYEQLCVTRLQLPAPPTFLTHDATGPTLSATEWVSKNL